MTTQPVSWMDWIYGVYPPDQFIIQPQFYSKTIAAAAASSGSDTIKMTVPGFCFEVRTTTWVTASGAAPTFPVRLIISNAGGNNWMGEVAAAIANISGEQPATSRQFTPWIFPRELEQNEVLTFNVNNSLNAATPITCDITLVQYEVRKRVQPIQRIVTARNT